MLGKLKDVTGKLDKKALGAAVMLMIMSWAALPIVYFLIVRRRKNNVLGESGRKDQKRSVEVADKKMDKGDVKKEVNVSDESVG